MVVLSLLFGMLSGVLFFEQLVGAANNSTSESVKYTTILHFSRYRRAEEIGMSSPFDRGDSNHCS